MMMHAVDDVNSQTKRASAVRSLFQLYMNYTKFSLRQNFFYFIFMRTILTYFSSFRIVVPKHFFYLLHTHAEVHGKNFFVG